MLLVAPWGKKIVPAAALRFYEFENSSGRFPGPVALTPFGAGSSWEVVLKIWAHPESHRDISDQESGIRSANILGPKKFAAVGVEPTIDWL